MPRFTPDSASPSPMGWLDIMMRPIADRGGGAPGSLTETERFGSNPGGLRMLTHTPPDLAAGSPLVVVLHGCGQTAAAYDHGAGWSTLSDRLGFAVLAPEQPTSNNVNGCFNWFNAADITRDHGEAASIRQMIERMILDHDLARTRVFVTGLSAGGAMALAMLATYPEVFAGGAVIAGLPYGAAGGVHAALSAMRHAPSRTPRAWGQEVRSASSYRGPWPKLSVWHGSVDRVVNPDNAEAIVDQWSDVLGVSRSPSFRDEVDGRTRRVWRDAAGSAVLESYTLTGLGHGTPIRSGGADDACGAPGPFILEAGVSSSYRIAQFWGLAPPDALSERITPKASARLGDRVKPAASNRPREAQRPMAASVLQTLNPQKVVASALKAAGLLKE